ASRGKAHTVSNKAAFLWQKFPKFVLGFLLISLLATVGAFSGPQVTDLANVSRWAFLLTFAGVGLKTDFRELKKQGMRPFVVGALAELSITVVTLGLVLGAAAIFQL
ncbi:MAG: putative sulfate exporter family transporter, partial [Deltaproteobacteria bacterium]